MSADGLPINDESERLKFLTAPSGAESATQKTQAPPPFFGRLGAWLSALFSKPIVKAEEELSTILDSFQATLNAIQSAQPAANNHQIEIPKVLQFSTTHKSVSQSLTPSSEQSPSPSDPKKTHPNR